jgi:hypothetical protein
MAWASIAWRGNRRRRSSRFVRLTEELPDELRTVSGRNYSFLLRGIETIRGTVANRVAFSFGVSLDERLRNAIADVREILAGIRVVLIEAGGRDSNPLIHIPAGYMKLLDHPKITWGYIAETGPDKVAIGTDYPFPWNKVPVDHIMSTPGLSDDDKIAILGGTAAKLLGIN